MSILINFSQEGWLVLHQLKHSFVNILVLLVADFFSAALTPAQAHIIKLSFRGLVILFLVLIRFLLSIDDVFG
jgi:hypothetical protein